MHAQYTDLLDAFIYHLIKSFVAKHQSEVCLFLDIAGQKSARDYLFNNLKVYSECIHAPSAPLLFRAKYQSIPVKEIDKLLHLFNRYIDMLRRRSIGGINIAKQSLPTHIQAKVTDLVACVQINQLDKFDELLVYQSVLSILNTQNGLPYLNAKRHFYRISNMIIGHRRPWALKVSSSMLMLAAGLSIATAVGSMGFSVALGVGLIGLVGMGLWLFQYGRQKDVSKAMLNFSTSHDNNMGLFELFTRHFAEKGQTWVEGKDGRSAYLLMPSFFEAVSKKSRLQHLFASCKTMSLQAVDKGEGVYLCVSSLNSDDLRRLSDALPSNNEQELSLTLKC